MGSVVSGTGQRAIGIALLATFLSGLSASAATLAVSPAVISNTYAGMLTLQISGLTNGETVRVERVLDANVNGVVDPGDILTLRLALTDGQVATIGGATNLNVPGDVNPAGGAITAKLNYYAPGMDHLIGQHLWRLESPSGRFASVTNLFTVTNTTYAQSIAGAVRSSGTNVPRTVIVALNPLADESFVAMGLSDGGGNYSLKLPAGTYRLVGVKPGFVTDLTSSPVVTLAPAATLATNLTMLPGTRTISGKLADAANANATLRGVFLQAESDDGLFAPGWTDTAGNFNLTVTAAEWFIEPAYEDLNRAGYLCSDEETQRVFNTSTGSVSGVVLLATKASALIYGRIVYETGAPLAGARFWAHGSLGGVMYHDADPVADAEGNYSAALIGGQSSGDNWWNLLTDPVLNPGLSNRVVSGFLIGVPVLSGQAIRQDFRAINATNRITGWVKDHSGSAVPGVGVFGWANLGGANYYGSGYTTDSAGNYGMNVLGGTWVVQASADDLLDAGYNCSPAKTLTLPSGQATLNFRVFPLDQPGLAQAIQVSPTQFRFSLHGEPFVDYQIQYSTSLNQWYDLVILTPQMQGYAYANFMFTDNAASGPRRFYRAIRLSGSP